MIGRGIQRYVNTYRRNVKDGNNGRRENTGEQMIENK